jgi:hypothetical protein
MANAKGCDRANENHCQRQPDAEAKNQRGAERKFPELQAEQQNRDRSRAWNEPSRQSEQDDLPCGHLTVREAPVDFLGMLALMIVRVSRWLHKPKLFVKGCVFIARAPFAAGAGRNVVLVMVMIVVIMIVIVSVVVVVVMIVIMTVIPAMLMPMVGVLMSPPAAPGHPCGHSHDQQA